MGGSSSSSSSQQTYNTDRRQVTGEGSIGINSDNSQISVSVESLDKDVVSRALDSVDSSNAALGTGYEKLLSATEKLFERGESLIGQTQKSVADAYSMAQTDAKGTIDNRTITVLAVAGVAALWAFKANK